MRDIYEKYYTITFYTHNRLVPQYKDYSKEFDTLKEAEDFGNKQVKKKFKAYYIKSHYKKIN